MTSQSAGPAFLLDSSALPLAEMRPSLRAAIDLEALHGGFPALLTKIAECDTATIKAVITATAPQRHAKRLIRTMATVPLGRFFEAALPALYGVVEALLPKASNTPSEAAQKPVEWQEAFAELYRIGTGWLGWTPATTWAASPQEIIDAFEGHVAKLKALHGGEEEEQSRIDPNQAEKNVAEGLDPEFDREGLKRLMSLSGQKIGDTI